MNYEQKKDIQTRILEISGQSLSIDDALDEWQREHTAMLRLHDENTAYQIVNRKLLMALTMAEKTVTAIEAEAGMFITPRTRAVIAKFRDLNNQLENAKAGSQELNQGDKP